MCKDTQIKGEMMKMKKLLAAMLACAMLASFAACSSSEDKPAADNKPAETTEKTEDKKEETKKDDTTAADLPAIGVTIYKYDDNFMTYTRKAMENAAKDVAVLNLNDSQNDQTKQLEQIDVLINQGVKALIINLVDPSNAPVVAEKAKAANIPVVFVNKEYPEGTDKIDYDKCVYVGTTSEESGIIQGQLILDAWNANKETWDKNGDGKLQYVMLMGEVGHPDAEARTKYSIQTLNDNGVETQELANQSATWDTAKAKDLMIHGLLNSQLKLKQLSATTTVWQWALLNPSKAPATLPTASICLYSALTLCQKPSTLLKLAKWPVLF